MGVQFGPVGNSGQNPHNPHPGGAACHKIMHRIADHDTMTCVDPTALRKGQQGPRIGFATVAGIVACNEIK